METADQIDELLSAFESLKIPRTHVTTGLSNLIASNKQYRSLFVNRRLPDAGWSDVQIMNLIYTLSTLDANNKLAVSTDSSSSATTNGSSSSGSRWCGVGEREGRVYSALVSNRHYGLCHGMGRSGDITEPQPKAVGSTVLVRLARILVLDAVRRGSGLNGRTVGNHSKNKNGGDNHNNNSNGPASFGVLLPMCTGMSMALVLASLRQQQQQQQRQTDDSSSTNGRSIVLWSRIDQKSCYKAVQTAGLACHVVETCRRGDAVVTDVQAMEDALNKYKDRVLAVITTTSCFAPRQPDQVDAVARLCARFECPHIINNAYGLQCHVTSKLINRACTVGRVDAVVCSTDKNFLVPVGGAIVLSPDEKVIQGVGKVYAGRASSSPIVDLFITLLSMGMNGYKQLLQRRMTMLETFPKRLAEVAAKHSERLLECPTNTISFGITLDTLARPRRENEDENEYVQSISKDISRFGAMLFSRCVSGTRVVPRGESKTIGGQDFIGFGSSVTDYPHAYMTAACAIGVTAGEIDEFLLRLDKTLKEFKRKMTKNYPATSET